MTDLHDVSTIGGSFSRFIFRWKYPLMLGAIVILAGLGTVIATSMLMEEADIPESTFVISGSKLMFHGNQSKFEDRHFDAFPGFPTFGTLQASNPTIATDPSGSPTLIDTIEIKWVRISGPEFTAQLAHYAPNLRILHLNNVTIADHLQPLSLPLLEEFYLNQGLEPEERNAPDYILNKAPTPWLQSTLFFLNDTSLDIAKKMSKVYTSNINVTIYLKGSVTYQLNPKFNEVRLDISNCNEILDKLPKTYKLVSLGRCVDLTPTSIHPGVTFLNFYIVSLTTERLSGILKNLKNLEEFYAEIPDGPVDISLNDLAPSLKILSASSMRILNSGNKSHPGIKEFYFGSENQYGWIPNRVTNLNESLFINFGNIFPSVEKVGLFDLESGERYTFLESVLAAPSVKWVILENFLRGKNGSMDLVDERAMDSVEGQLDQLGLSKDASDIVIETAATSSVRSGRIMTRMEKLWFRYTYLGWCPIDSWPKFLYVQKIIEAGGLLI